MNDNQIDAILVQFETLKTNDFTDRRIIVIREPLPTDEELEQRYHRLILEPIAPI
jgi:hypothetical protein